jgi:hypothetical protein
MMAHECPNCGETFDSLDAFGDHPCVTEFVEGDDTDDPAASAPEIDEHLAAARDGDVEALHAAMSTFAERLEKRRGDGRAGSDGLYWTYFESLADCLDEHVRREGWSLLSEFTSEYDPRLEDDGAPAGRGPVENAVGRLVVRTRLAAGVEAVPAGALEYLRAFGRDESAASEESFVYGWGIGHPDHAVADHLHAMASDHYLWVGEALTQAFYADQAAATDLLERLVTDDDLAFTWPPHSDEGVDSERFFLATVADVDAFDVDAAPDGYLPRFWDWRSEFDYRFEWAPTTRRRVRQLVVDRGLDEELPEDWTLADLAQ